MVHRDVPTRLSLSLLDLAVRSRPVRHWLLRRGERRIHDFFMQHNPDGVPDRVQELRFRAAANLLRAFNRALDDGRISPRVRHRLVTDLIGRVMTNEARRHRAFVARHHRQPPNFLVVSPTKRCNLHCAGCYAASGVRHDNTLPHDVLQRILDEKRRLWGSHFTVVSGGEPLLYRSEGKTLLDVFAANPDQYFLMYTNGTLLDRETAQRLADLGNVTPAFSVEGWEEQTDARRGRGVFRRILRAMSHLREAGVPFGISITVTRRNAETVMSDAFIDFFLAEQGAVYAWVFQYMPIGRGHTVDLMVTPAQRRWLLERQLALLERRGLFVVDFWNGGPMSVGCMAAGRSTGYLYIDWDGNVAPCVFFPYTVTNIHDVYARGGTLDDVLDSDFFRAIRTWQDTYLGTRHGRRAGNLFRPCPIRDHYNFAYRAVQHFGARPMDPDAAAALADPDYRRRMRSYGAALARELDPVWEREVYPETATGREDAPAAPLRRMAGAG